VRQRPLQPRRLHLQPPPAPPVSPCRVPIGPLGAETDRAAGPAFSASSSSARERTVGGRARPSASRASVASIAARRSAGSSEKMLSRPPCPPAPPRSVLCPLPRAIAPAPAPARARAPARADSGRAGGRAVCGRGARSVAANWFLRSARYPPRAAESVPPWGKPQYRLGRGGTDRAAAGRGATMATRAAEPWRRTTTGSSPGRGAPPARARRRAAHGGGRRSRRISATPCAHSPVRSLNTVTSSNLRRSARSRPRNSDAPRGHVPETARCRGTRAGRGGPGRGARPMREVDDCGDGVGKWLQGSTT